MSNWYNTYNRVSIYKNVSGDTACTIISNRGDSIDFTRLVINNLMIANTRSGVIIFDLYLEQRLKDADSVLNHMQGEHVQDKEDSGEIVKFYIARNMTMYQGETLFFTGDEIKYDTNEWDLMYKHQNSAYSCSIKVTTRRKTADEIYVDKQIKQKLDTMKQSINY